MRDHKLSSQCHATRSRARIVTHQHCPWYVDGNAFWWTLSSNIDHAAQARPTCVILLCRQRVEGYDVLQEISCQTSKLTLVSPSAGCQVFSLVRSMLSALHAKSNLPPKSSRILPVWSKNCCEWEEVSDPEHIKIATETQRRCL